MDKIRLYSIVILLSFFNCLLAQPTGKVAEIVTANHKTLKVTILKESMDSLLVQSYLTALSIPKSDVLSITYTQKTLEPETIYTAVPPEQISFSKYKSEILLGLEINPFRLVDLDQEFITASGTLTFFRLKHNFEIAFPVYYSKTNLTYLPTGGKVETTTIDCRYRHYISLLPKMENSVYLSAGIRLTQIKGSLGDRYNAENGMNPPHTYIYPQDTENKFGLSIGFGSRFLTTSGFYLGASFSIGRYFFGRDNRFFPDYYEDKAYIIPDEDHRYFIDIELFKIGWAF